MHLMAFESNNQAALTGQSAAVAGAETIPALGNSAGRDLMGRMCRRF